MKYDTGTIENFDGLTADELREIIRNIDIPEDMTDAYNRLKAQFDKTSSAYAATKKDIASKQSASEREAAEKEEAYRELQEQFDALQRKTTITEFAAKYAALGMDEKLASATAEAQYNGESEKVFANLATLKANNEKALRADIAKNAPKIDTAGSAKTYKTKAEIMAIPDAADRQAAIAANPEIFPEIGE